MNLKQLASILGLSPTTVSRAINGYPEVNETTRQRVLTAAKRHNYRPNVRAIQLATGRSMAIGHVIPLKTRHEMVNPVFADFIAGAGETYSSAGYDMLLTVVSDEKEHDAYHELHSRGAVDGIILHAPNEHDPRIAMLTQMGLPFVLHGRASGVTAPYSWVDVNNRRAFKRATEFLIDLGHRNIAIVNGLEYMDFAIRRRAGYLDAMTERGIPLQPCLMSAHEMTETAGYQSSARMLAAEVRPTAFVVSSMILAIGVRRAIQEQGLELGRDISVIIHDDELGYLRNGTEVPIFTATRSSVRDAGRLAAEMLIDIIATADETPRHHLLEAELIIGRSTGPAPGRT